MSNLVSFPTSIRERLEEARKLTIQNKPAEAASLLATTCSELARTNPELATFVLCLATGARQLVISTVDITITDEHVKNLFGTNLVPRTTKRSVTRTFEVR